MQWLYPISNGLSARLRRARRRPLLLRWGKQEDTMRRPRHPRSDDHKHPPWIDEPDIGSGEKTPADLENEELIRQIPPLPPAPAPPARPGHAEPA